MTTEQHDMDRAFGIAETLTDLTDNQASWLIMRLMSNHNFAGVVFTPEDARAEIENVFGGCDIEREVTDADVAAMLGSWEWRKGLGEALCERGFEMLCNAYDDLFDADGNLRPAE